MNGIQGLVIAIVVGGYGLVILIGGMHAYRERHKSDISASDQRIRRELSRHSKETGNGD